MPIYFTVNTIAELCCLLTAIVCLRKEKHQNWKSLILYLAITIFAEMLGICSKKVWHKPNAWIYNLLLLVQVFFYLNMFRHLIYKEKRGFPLITIAAIILVVVYIAEAVNNTFISTAAISKFNYYNATNSVFSVVVVFFCLYYLYLLLQSETYLPIGQLAEFWWVAGALFFYFGSTVLNIFYFKLAPLAKEQRQFFTTYLIYTLNIVLYGCWTFSFICRKWMPNLKN